MSKHHTSQSPSEVAAPELQPQAPTNSVSFKVSANDAALIRAIVKRARGLTGVRDCISLSMDITATHANGNPLRLDEMLEADDFNFAHDIYGIMRNINRETGKLENFFLLRFSGHSAKEACNA